MPDHAERVEAVDVLRRIPFFNDLNDDELQTMAEIVVIGHYKRNQVLFVEGQSSHSLYFICSGRVKVYRVSPDGREQILHLLSDGEPVAVVPFFDRGPYPANAEVLVDSKLAFIRAADFDRLAMAKPSILLHMLRMLAQRLRRAQGDITSLALKSVTGRLASTLLDLARRTGKPVTDGTAFDLQLSRQDLGNLIGASRETTTRLLHQFRRDGVIQLAGSRVVILDQQRLQEWSMQ